MQNTSPQNVWFITGAARGIGLSLARQVLTQGDAVAATSRNLESLRSALGEDSAQFLALAVDLTDEASTKAAIDRTIAHFGRVDRVVNNAGYGQQGAIEALSDAELRRNFDVNVFAPLNVLRHALPHLRALPAAGISSTSPPSSAFRAAMRAGAAMSPANSRWPA